MPIWLSEDRGVAALNRRLKSIDVIDILSDLFILRGVRGHIRSGNGPELVAKAVQTWIMAVVAETAYITPGSPWDNHASRHCFAVIRSFNARLRDELLDGEILYSLVEARIVIESGRRHDNACVRMIPKGLREAHSDTSRRPRRSSFPPQPCGRLRNPIR